MEKSHLTRFRMRNYTDQFSLNHLDGIFRCRKCTRYNNINTQHVNQSCSFCGNPHLPLAFSKEVGKTSNQINS